VETARKSYSTGEIETECDELQQGTATGRETLHGDIARESYSKGEIQHGQQLEPGTDQNGQPQKG
jgi:hypothetical protein